MKSIAIVKMSISAMFVGLLSSCSIFYTKLPHKTVELSPQTTQNLEVIKNLQPLGTKFTMEATFFKDKLLQQGIEVMIPDADEREFIHQTIFDELDRGLLLTETKVRYLGIIQNLIAMGAEAVILGCTEIPLLIKPEDCTIPVFDTTSAYHLEKGHRQYCVQFGLPPA
jgi:aspartate racemase